MALNLPPASESRFLPSPLLVWGKVELINEREAYFAQWKATAGSEARKPNPQSRDVVLLRATIVARWRWPLTLTLVSRPRSVFIALVAIS